jgi:hypothetical protein
VSASPRPDRRSRPITRQLEARRPKSGREPLFDPRPKLTLGDRRRMMVRYADTLFGRRQGIVACALGVGGHFEGKSYKVDIRQVFFKWPEERSALIRWALENYELYDIYINPILRTEAFRRKEKSCATNGTHPWVDIDIDLESDRDLVETLHELCSEGVLIVQSGGRGSWHLYPAIDRPYPPGIIETLNKGLSDYVNKIAGVMGHRKKAGEERADGLWYETALLRLPGTLNHKGRALGDRSYPVLLDEDDWCGQPWSAEELARKLGIQSLTASTAETNRQKRAAGKKTPKSRPPKTAPFPVDPEALPFDLPPYIEHRTSYYRPKGPDKTRSAQLHGLMAAGIEHGLTDEQLFLLAHCSKPALDRATERGGDRWERQLIRDVEWCLTKLRPTHDHAGLTCGEANCSSAGPITHHLEELAMHFFLHYRSRSLSTDQRVFGAFLQVAREIKQLDDVDMSIRRLAELSATNPDTGWRSLQRLLEESYLLRAETLHTRPGAPLPRHADTFALDWDIVNLHTHTNHVHTQNKNPVVMCPKFAHCGHDAWRYGALGQTFATYQALEAGILNIVEIASFYGIAVTTVSRHVQKLGASELAEQKPDGSWIARRRPLDEVAAQWGTSGTLLRKQQQHAEDREMHDREVKASIAADRERWRQEQLDRGAVLLRPGVYGPPKRAV